MNKKIILIPGWMNTRGMYGEKYDVLEIWKDRISPEKKIEADFVVAHSLGCNWGILNWEKHKNTKLILVNPILPKRKLREWFLRWKKFKREEASPKSKEVVKGMKRKIFGAKMCYQLLKKDFDDALGMIPRKNIHVFCGEKDVFYCDEEFKKYVRSKNMNLIEVKNVGHDWGEEFDREIEKIITPS